MRISPTAIGIFVLPLLMVFIKEGVSGIKYPRHKPSSMATKIQRVRYWSKKESFLFKGGL
jgi:hypothetical protein